LLEMLRDMMLHKTGGMAQEIDLAEDDLNRLKAQAEKISAEDLLRCFRILFSAEMDITRSSCPRIALELCLMEMITLKQAVPLEDLLGKVQALTANRSSSSGFELPAQPFQGRAERAPASKLSQQAPPQQPSAPQPAAVGLTGNAADFIEFVRSKKYVQAVGHLQQATLELDGDCLRIIVPQKSFHAGWLRESSAQARLGELASEFFGRQIRLEVEETVKKKSPENGGLTQRREAERDALHNPVVQRVVETFQGKVIEVKTNTE